jgi:hypothetical protein
VVNIALNLLLLPDGSGRGISLVASYAVVLVLMYIFTQRLFKVPYEWLRLAQAAGPNVSRARRRAAAADERVLGIGRQGRRSGSPIRCCSGRRAS